MDPNLTPTPTRWAFLEGAGVGVVRDPAGDLVRVGARVRVRVGANPNLNPDQVRDRPETWINSAPNQHGVV